MYPKLTIGLLIVAILMVLFAGTTVQERVRVTDASAFYKALDRGEVYQIHVAGPEVYYRTGASRQRMRANVPLDPETAHGLVSKAIHVKDPFDPELVHSTIRLTYDSNRENPWWMSLASTWLPFVVLIGIWFYFLKKMQGQTHNQNRVRRTEAPALPKLAAFGGYEPVKTQLKELTDILKDPERFQRLGARLPRSAMLTGPSGTGKTLLARAVAGEAGLPLLEISGADFVEMFLGVGARRVRELFEQAVKAAPCVILIDRIEVLARRSEFKDVDVSLREQEQAMNQLVAELEKLDAGKRVLVLATTSALDLLDPSLLAPGRFDRTITLGLPDQKDREAIFKASTAGLTVEGDLDFPCLAQMGTGLDGARLRQVVDEAALIAALNQRTGVTMQDCLDAYRKLHPTRASEPAAV